MIRCPQSGPCTTTSPDRNRAFGVLGTEVNLSVRLHYTCFLCRGSPVECSLQPQAGRKKAPRRRRAASYLSGPSAEDRPGGRSPGEALVHPSGDHLFGRVGSGRIDGTNEGDDLPQFVRGLIGGIGACTLPNCMRVKPSNSAEPSVTSLNSTHRCCPEPDALT